MPFERFTAPDFLARIPHQPFVKNVTQERKIVVALCAVNAVIDGNETDAVLWKIISLI